MEDMYNEMRDKMNNPQKVRPTNADWSRFQKYRKIKDGLDLKKVIWPYWAVAILLLMLGLSNLYWLSRGAENQAIITNNTHIVDTVYITKHINTANTINIKENTSIQLESLSAELELIKTQYRNLKFRLEDQSQTLTDVYHKKGRLESSNAVWKRKREEIKRLNQEIEAKIFDSIELKTSKSSLNVDTKLEERLFVAILGPLPLVEQKEIQYSNRKLIHPSKIILVKKNEPLNLLTKITPKTFSLNTNIAYVLSLSEDGSKGFAGDVKATSLFNRNLRGYFGFRLINNNNRIDENTPGVIYPMLPEGDEIEHTDEHLSQFSGTVGLEYLLNIERRLRPYLGLGYGRVFSNKAKYIFEIEAANGNEYYIAPEDKIVLEAYDQMIMSLGTDINLSRKLDMRIGINYTHAIQNNYNSIFLVEGGVYYHF